MYLDPVWTFVWLLALTSITQWYLVTQIHSLDSLFKVWYSFILSPKTCCASEWLSSDMRSDSSANSASRDPDPYYEAVFSDLIVASRSRIMLGSDVHNLSLRTCRSHVGLAASQRHNDGIESAPFR
jgi:hypothetical protein